MSNTVLYLDAPVLALSTLSEDFASELDDLVGRVRVMFPLDAVVFPPLVTTRSFRRRVDALQNFDVVGAPGNTGTMLARAVELDVQVRWYRGEISQIWILTVAGKTISAPRVSPKLSRLDIPIRFLPVRDDVYPVPLCIEDIEEVLLDHARKRSRSHDE